MSTRELAISILNGFTDEQIDEFIERYAKSEEEASKKRSIEAFEHLKKIVEKNAPLFADAADNDKEVLLEYRMKKYGEGL